MAASNLAEWSLPDGRGGSVPHRLVELDSKEFGPGRFVVESLASAALGEPSWRLMYAWSSNSHGDLPHLVLTSLATLLKEKK